MNILPPERKWNPFSQFTFFTQNPQVLTILRRLYLFEWFGQTSAPFTIFRAFGMGFKGSRRTQWCWFSAYSVKHKVEEVGWHSVPLGLLLPHDSLWTGGPEKGGCLRAIPLCFCIPVSLDRWARKEGVACVPSPSLAVRRWTGEPEKDSLMA